MNVPPFSGDLAQFPRLFRPGGFAPPSLHLQRRLTQAHERDDAEHAGDHAGGDEVAFVAFEFFFVSQRPNRRCGAAAPADASCGV